MPSTHPPPRAASVRALRHICGTLVGAGRNGRWRSPSGRSGSEISDLRPWAVALGFVLFLCQPLAAENVDVIHLRNGDRITCEIKRLDRSLLSISTDPLGKASVHWGDVADLVSPRRFDVQVESGEHFLGTPLASAPGSMVLRLDDGTSKTLALTDLIRLAPIGASVWSRVDGNVDAGFSFAQANLETHWTVNGAATYRSPRYQFGANVASQLTAREDADATSRNSLNVNATRSLANRWYTLAWGQFQQNQELSLELRAVAGGGVGRDLSHTDHRLWSTYVGLAYTHERFSGEPTDQSAEAAVGGQIDFFTPSHEDMRITNSILSYFNVSGRQRVRVEVQSAWRHEFLNDFYWSLNGFESFDGDPPADQKRNDSGVSFTLGWKF
jgi:hypothetical protein